MNIVSLLRQAVGMILATSLAISSPTPVFAQTVPAADNSRPTAAQNRGLPNDSTFRQGDPGFVMLADLPATGGTPRAASPTNIARDTPVLSRAEFLSRYPNVGAAGYNRIVAANQDVCSQRQEIATRLLGYDQRMALLQEEYTAIMQVYQSLPGEIRRGTTVMLISQAVQTGALCLLSGGLYCIAAVVGGIANMFQSVLNRRLQLANIRLSIAILRHAELSAAATRDWFRMSTMWLDMAGRYCDRYMPAMGGTSMQGTLSAQLPTLNIDGTSTSVDRPQGIPTNLLPPGYENGGNN